jgi:hypothetical protein
MSSHPRLTRIVGAFVASSLIQALLAGVAAACSNGNGFPLLGV